MGKAAGARRWVIVISAVTSVVALVACGGGGGAAPPDTIAPAVADQLTADASVLQAGDLPGSFQSSSSSSASSSSDDHGEGSVAVDQCFASATDQKLTSASRTGRASRTFVRGAGLDAFAVAAEVDVFHDDAGLREFIAAFGQPSVTNCLRRAFVDSFSALGGTVGELTVVPSKVEGVGDDQAGFVVSGGLSVNGVVIAFSGEFDFTRVGRVALTLSLLSLNSAPDHNIAVSAMKAMVRRLPT